MNEFAKWLMSALHSLKQLRSSDETSRNTPQLVAAFDMASAHSADGLADMRRLQELAGMFLSSF
jgi:hypothetical protein